MIWEVRWLKILVSVVRFRPWAPFLLFFKQLSDEWHEDCRESCLLIIWRANCVWMSVPELSPLESGRSEFELQRLECAQGVWKLFTKNGSGECTPNLSQNTPKSGIWMANIGLYLALCGIYFAAHTKFRSFHTACAQRRPPEFITKLTATCLKVK